MKPGSGWLIAIALLAWLPAMAGSREAVWAGGLVLLGVAWMAVRARGEWREIPWWCWLGGFLTLAMPAIGWLVSGAIEPGWQGRLREDDPPLGPVVATWPLWLESWALVWLAVLWVWLLAGLPLDRSLRRSGVRWLTAMGLVVVALGTADMAISGELVGWWGFERGGPFANRNQFGLVTAVVAVAAMALAWEDAARGRFGAVVWAMCLLVAAGALVWIGSRGAFLGCLAGLTAVGAARLIRRPGSIGPILGIGALVLIFGVGLLTVGFRSLARWFEGEGWSADARWLLFQDVGTMIGEQPWTGVGLAGFRWIFPAYRDALDAPAPVLHPESDFLWWAAETGWPWVLMVVGLFLLGVVLERQHGDALLASAAWGAAATALAHGLVDVGLHRPGSFLPVLTLVGLWVGHLRGNERMGYPVACRLGLIAGGVVAGLWLVLAGTTIVPGDRRVIQARDLPAESQAQRANALQATLDALHWAPLDPVLNFRAGWMLAVQEKDAPRSKLLLERARRWAPHDAALAFEAGRLWLEQDPLWAFEAWRETLERSKGQAFDEWFGRMEAATTGRPGLREGLYFLFAEVPGLDYVRFARSDPEELEAIVDQLMDGGAGPWADRPLGRSRLISVWMERQGSDRVAEALRQDRGLEDWFWQPVALAWGRQDPKGAVHYALEMLRLRLGELSKPNLDEVRADRARWRAEPEALEAALRVALAEWGAGNPQGALDILGQIRATPEVVRVRAAILFELGRFEEAWAVLRPELHPQP